MRIITGLQPSGKLHIGNYFGAMEPAVRMQDRGESYYFLADYHAMSTVHDADTLRENCKNLATDFLAVGLDPENASSSANLPCRKSMNWPGYSAPYAP